MAQSVETDANKWVRRETAGTLTVGITEFAQEALGLGPPYPDLDSIVTTAWEWHSQR